MLMSPGTRNGFPLAIEVEKMEVVEAEFNADFCARMIEKLEWAALVATVASVRATRNSSRNSFAAHHAHAQPHRRSRATLRAAQLKLEKGELPPAVPEDYATNEEFLKALHHVLLEVEIVEGVLVCPETDKRFPIKEGIPSML
jgi:multifunctional methyltransferase subunit TRM112